jgi:hypothetical protein
LKNWTRHNVGHLIANFNFLVDISYKIKKNI